MNYITLFFWLCFWLLLPNNTFSSIENTPANDNRDFEYKYTEFDSKQAHYWKFNKVFLDAKTGKSAAISQLHFSRDGKYLAFLNHSYINIWDIKQDFKQILIDCGLINDVSGIIDKYHNHHYKFEVAKHSHIGFGPNNNIVCVSNRIPLQDPTVKIFDITGSCLKSKEISFDELKKLARDSYLFYPIFSNDGNKIYFRNSDCCILTLDANSLDIIKLHDSEISINSLCLINNKVLAATHSGKKTSNFRSFPEICNVEDDNQQNNFDIKYGYQDRSNIGNPKISTCGNFCALNARESQNIIYIFGVGANKEFIKTLKIAEPNSGIPSYIITNNKIIFTSRNKIFIYDLILDKYISKFDFADDYYFDLMALSKDEKLIAISSSNGTVILLKLENK